MEVICAWLIIENNHYQGARFFNSSSSIVASLNTFSQGVREYFLLRKINSTLAEENAVLRTRLEQMNQYQYALANNHPDSVKLDSAVIKQYDFISAKVVANTVNRYTNFLTINKGADDGVEKGMAVISPLGIVGKVKTTSKHFSVVTSILHIDVQVSVVIKSSGYFGTVQWDGRDPDYVKLKFIPKHLNPVKGDTIVTSGYNAVYPEGIMVGVVDEVKKDEKMYYDLTVKLSQDFRKLSYVEVVRSFLRHERDSLETHFFEEPR